MAQSEDAFRLMVELAPDIIFAGRPDGSNHYLNQRFYEYTGLAPHAGENWGWLQAVHPEDVPSVRAAWTRHVQERQSHEITLRLKGKNGDYRWFIARARPAHDRDSRTLTWFGTVTDIHNLTATQAALRLREEEYRAMFDLASVGKVQADPRTGRYIRVNRKFCDMTGYSADELVTKTIRDITHPDDRERDFEGLQRLARGEATEYSAEKRYMRKDGSVLWVQLDAVMLRDSQGAPLWAVGVIQDIAERKHAEEALRESEERLRLAGQAAGFGTYSYDVATQVNTWSPELNAIFGMPEQAVVPVEEVIARIHPDDRARVTSMMAASIDPQGAGLIEDEHRIIWPDGSVRWVLMKGRTFFEQDSGRRRAVRAGGTVLDVTERKRAETALRESENRFKAFMDNSPAVAFMKDEDSRYVYINHTFRSLFKMEDIDFLGKTDVELFSVEAAVRLRENDAAILHGHAPQHTIERLPTPDGVLRHWLIFKFPIDASARRLVGGVAFDITDRVQAETALEESKTELEKLNRTLEEQVKQRTAELLRKQQALQALTVELSRTEARERKRLAADLHDNLAQMLLLCKIKLEVSQRNTLDGRHAFKAAQELLDEALTYTRTLMSNLRPPLLGDEDDLRTAVSWVVEKLQRHGLTVTVYDDGVQKVLEEEVLTVTYQAIHELLFNVLKHAQTTHATVVLKRADAYLEATVFDEGAGFDLSTHPPRLDEGRFGLLSIRERVEPLGGRCEITSHVGVGTCAKLIVPVKANTSPAHAHNPRSHPPSTTTDLTQAQAPVARSKIQVLLVDDHRIMREGLRFIIEGQDDLQIIAEAGDGTEAIDLARNLHPDIVVMDVNLPTMNGVEATRQIKSEFPDIAVIGLSVHEEDKMAQTMRGAGASAYLSKGGSFETLCQAIRTASIKPCANDRLTP
jgi:PAS domain S-box-containing protein